jgi:hypothetical protein
VFLQKYSTLFTFTLIFTQIFTKKNYRIKNTLPLNTSTLPSSNRTSAVQTKMPLFNFSFLNVPFQAQLIKKIETKIL